MSNAALRDRADTLRAGVRTGRAVGLALALVALLALVAPRPVDAATVSTARAPLLVLGDSLCVGARDFDGDMTPQLRAGGWDPSYACAEGMGLPWGISQVEARASVPRTVVVALGTNPGPGESGFSSRLATMRSALFARGARQIVWVDYANRAGGYASKNVALRQFAGRHGDTVVDWSSRIAANPSWFKPDGLHYTPAGQKAWVAAIVGGLDPARARAIDPSVDMAVRPGGAWVLTASGEVYTDGTARSHGDVSGMSLNGAPRAIVPTASGEGYWIMGADGGVFSFGDAAFHGSTGAMRLNAPVVSMAATPSGNGYWLLARDGGVFTFGDAAFHGSTGGMHLNQPVVGMTPTTKGDGYWLVASDGGVFTFGAARFHGSAGALRLNQPVVDMAGTATDGGYWLLGADGGVFTYGNAPFRGTTVGSGSSAVAVTPTTGGYVQLLADGRMVSLP